MASQQNQLREGQDLGDLAYINIDDLNAAVTVVRTKEQLNGSNGLTAEAIIITDAAIRGIFYYDSTDTGTADDGVSVLKTIDERRYKRRNLIRRYTPTSSADTNIALGEICYDDTRFYVRTASNVVKYITFSGTL